MVENASPADAGVVFELLQAFRCSKTMFAAVELGVFDALSAGPRSLIELAPQLGANVDALERLLDACVGLQLLERTERGYQNTAAAGAYLSRR